MKILKVSLQDPNAVERFALSLRETGFGVLTDHPISQDLIQKVFQDWAEFFARSEKTQYTFDPKTQEGYFPFRTENAKDSPVKDLKEFYHFYRWSKLPAGLSDRTLTLFRELETLASQLLTWIEEQTPQSIRNSLSMPLREMSVESRTTLLRPIHYPPLTGQEEAGAIRAAAHEDINLITLLPSATAPGLQVKNTEGQWMDVECDPGQIVINVGDMLQEATQGYYRSTTHQVINIPGGSRFSMPLFLHPRSEVRLSPRCTAGEYLEERLKEIGLLKK